MRNCLQIALMPLLLFGGALIYTNAGALNHAGEELVNTFVVVTTILMWGGIALLLGAPVVVGVIMWRRHMDRINRQRDGSFPLREYKLGGGAKLLVDPNAMVSAAAVIHPEYGYVETEPRAGYEHQLAIRQGDRITRHLQAMNPGDDILERIGGMMPGQRSRMDAATGKLLAGFYNRPPRATNPEPPRQIIEASAPAPVERLTLSDALRRSSSKAFLMGQAADGKQAIFDLDAHHNLGIIGSPGTGKSHGSGYQLVLAAIAHGYHVIILDPKGGVDFGMFARSAEWQETDPWLIADQLGALTSEHERRIQLLRQHNASNMWELNGHAPPRVMTVIEEYGALQEDLQASNPAKAKQVDHQINQLMRTGRATGLHFALLDQDTEFWSNAVRGAAKCRLVYKVDESEAARIREYTAPDLPDRGAFLLRKNEYRSWHVQPKVRQLLAQLPALDAPRLLAPISSERSDYTAADAPHNGWEELDESNADGSAGKWQTLIENWFGENPQALNGPARGITDIARRMAAAEGNVKPYDNYKGVASQLFHAYRDNRSE